MLPFLSKPLFFCVWSLSLVSPRPLLAAPPHYLLFTQGHLMPSSHFLPPRTTRARVLSDPCAYIPRS